MRKSLSLIASLGMVSVLGAAAYDYEFTPLVGGVWKEGNLNLENERVVGGEFQFNNTGLPLAPEISLLHSPSVDYEPNIGDTDITRILLNGVHTYETEGGVQPFAKVGIGYERVKERAFENVNSWMADAGGGVKFPINEMLALKAEAIYMIKRNDNRWDNNLAALVGLTISFGEEEKAAPAPAPVAPVVLDDDGDGVPNSSDNCPATPEGAAVGPDGCALDSDKDGVADYMDKCPDTPLEAKVDTAGCPLDSDKDGILDHEDLCPNTVAGVSVDKNGCAETIILEINFANDSAVVDEANSPKLQEYIDFMKRNTVYNTTIVGHTDSKGSAAYNQKLSEKRAKAVMERIVAGGIDASRVAAKGMGESEPIADNATPEGMAKNRRIEAKLELRQ